MDKFAIWLMDQMQVWDMSQADLARRSGLTRSTISYYLSPKSKAPDEAALRKIAHAFKLPPETIYRVAGILPQQSPESAEEPDPAPSTASLPLLPVGAYLHRRSISLSYTIRPKGRPRR